MLAGGGGGGGDELVVRGDSVACLEYFSEDQRLASGGWDSDLRVWDVNPSSPGFKSLLAGRKLAAPVLALAAKDSKNLLAGGCDCNLTQWDVEANVVSVVGTHEEPIRGVFWLPELNTAVTGGWDCAVKFWDLRSSEVSTETTLPHRVYAMDASHRNVVVGMANRDIAIYDTRSMSAPMRMLPSPLRTSTNCLRLFTEGDGFALGSLEGRCAIRYISADQDKAMSFAFKCHRNGNKVHPVNDIAWHPTQVDAFVTVGGDSSMCFWDKKKKQRLKLYSNLPQTIACCKFNKAGSVVAYAASYDWSTGPDPSRSPYNAIVLHTTTFDDLMR